MKIITDISDIVEIIIKTVIKHYTLPKSIIID